MRQERNEKGDVIPIYTKNDKIEGYALLIEEDGESFTYSEKHNIYKSQRWLIEWVDLADYPDIKTKHDMRMTQASMQGRRCHRVLDTYLAKESQHYLHRGDVREPNLKDTKESNGRIDSFLTVNGKEIY